MQHFGFESRETEFEPGTIDHGTRKVVLPRATRHGQLRKLRSAGIGQAEQLRTFVESLARRIVTRLAEQRVRTDRARLDQHGVTAGHQQRQMRKRRRIGLEQRREQMPLEMVNADRRHAPGIGQRTRECRATEQRADQSGSGGVRDAVDVRSRGSRPRQRRLDQRQQALHVVARGKLGHHATVNTVQIDLREQLVREQPAVRVEHGGGGLVAGGFDGQNAHGFAFSLGDH